MRTLRPRLQTIFQDPMSALNPRRRIRATLTDPLLLHAVCDREAAEARLRRVIERVGLPPDVLDRFPHQLSGGQRQRIGIARAVLTLNLLLTRSCRGSTSLRRPKSSLSSASSSVR